MSQITGLNQILVGNTPDANVHRQNFQLIQEKYNFHDKNKTLVHGIESNDEIVSVNYINGWISKLFFVGEVIAIWDSEDATVPVLDSDHWVLMDGGEMPSAGQVFFNTTVLPDMTEAYVSIDNVCSTNTEGSNTFDLNHSEHLFSHNHSISHEHAFSSNHGVLGVVLFNIGVGDGDNLYGGVSGCDSYTVSERTDDFNIDDNNNVTRTFNPLKGYASSISTYSGNTTNLSVTSTVSSSTGVSAASKNLNIDRKPMSVKVRYYLRYN